MYLFMIVGTLVLVDIVFLIPTTAVSSYRLRREYEEIEGDVSNQLCIAMYVPGLKPCQVIWVIWVMFCLGQVDLTLFIKYLDPTWILQ